MNGLTVKKVVVPIDSTYFSFEAIKTARAMVEDVKQLHLIHVMDHICSVQPGAIPEVVLDERRSEDATEKLQKKLSELGYDELPITIAFGDYAKEIDRFAEKINADLIVLSSHDRRGFERFLFGSIAQRVVHFAHCPVLVLRHHMLKAQEKHKIPKEKCA